MSKSQEKHESIEELYRKISELEEEKSRLETEARQFVQKRDRFNEEVKAMRDEILELRTERDALNSKVRELKQRREGTRGDIREQLESLRKTERTRTALAQKKPARSREPIQKEIEDIDWTIQTTPLTLQKDKELVQRVKQLETQLAVHKKLEHMAKKIDQLRVASNTMRSQNEALHEDLMEKARKSQETHEKMVGKIEKSKALKKEADEMHRQFVLIKEKTGPVQSEISALLDRIRQLKRETRERKQIEQQKNQDALRNVLQKKAEDKMKRGEKLSWEEFQLLAEKGIVDED